MSSALTLLYIHAIVYIQKQVIELQTTLRSKPVDKDHFRKILNNIYVDINY